MPKKNGTKTERDRHVGILKHFRLRPPIAQWIAREAKRRGYPHSENSVVNEILGRHVAQVESVLEGKTQLQTGAQK